MAKPKKDQPPEQIYIKEAAALLDREMATLRKWDRLEVLPVELRPQRGLRGWRFWTPDQIEGMRVWIKETQRWPGKGLPNYNPTQKALDDVMKKMRKPRKKTVAKRQAEEVG